MILIGDVHGKVDSYLQIIQNPRWKVQKSIQLGDFGFHNEHEWHLQNIDSAQHKILFGNHDAVFFRYAKHSLGDFGMYEGIFYIRGAYSIDQWHRKQGRDWWPEEEMGWKEWSDCIEAYEKAKPEIVISHDCPAIVRKKMWGITNKTVTSEGLQHCFEIHQPNRWFFGHHHESKIDIIENTHFQCLAELEVYEI